MILEDLLWAFYIVAIVKESPANDLWKFEGAMKTVELENKLTSKTISKLCAYVSF